MTAPADSVRKTKLSHVEGDERPGIPDGYHTLKEGDDVAFDVTNGSKGPQVRNVTRLQGPFPLALTRCL